MDFQFVFMAGVLVSRPSGLPTSPAVESLAMRNGVSTLGSVCRGGSMPRGVHIWDGVRAAALAGGTCWRFTPNGSILPSIRSRPIRSFEDPEIRSSMNLPFFQPVCQRSREKKKEPFRSTLTLRFYHRPASMNRYGKVPVRGTKFNRFPRYSALWELASLMVSAHHMPGVLTGKMDT
jgi:hypothetical protein